jgi:hypothetical protein
MTWMSRSVLALMAVVMVLGSSPPVRAGEGEGNLVELLVESADTPQEHKALAAYFRSKAEAHRAAAARHRSMASHYGGQKETLRKEGKQHCDRLVSLNDDEAAQYDALAKLHETQASE